MNTCHEKQKRKKTKMPESRESKIGRKYGTPPDAKDHRDLFLSQRVPIMTKAELPPSVSMFEFAAPVIDQLGLAACTGCGSSRGLKTWMNAHDYKWKHTPSALDIYLKARLLDGGSLTRDTGATIRSVFKALNEQGVCPEDSNPEWSWPFSASDDRWMQRPPEACQKAAALHKCVKYYRVPQIPEAIMTALFHQLPLIIGIVVYESFESRKTAKSGIIPQPGFFDYALGGHCLYLHSYGLYKEGYADGANSWGADKWGRHGHFSISIKKYLCNPKYTSDIWAPELYT